MRCGFIHKKRHPFHVKMHFLGACSNNLTMLRLSGVRPHTPISSEDEMEILRRMRAP